MAENSDHLLLLSLICVATTVCYIEAARSTRRFYALSVGLGVRACGLRLAGVARAVP